MPSLREMADRLARAAGRVDRGTGRAFTRGAHCVTILMRPITRPVIRGLSWFGLRLLRATVTRRDRAGPVRSVYAGSPIISIASIAKAERLLGVEADTLVWQTYFLTSAFTYNLRRLLRGPRWWKQLISGIVFVVACLRYRRFHYFYDRGILQPDNPDGRFRFREDELKLLRYLGKEVYFYAYGADVRTQRTTRALGEFNCCTECPTPGEGCICTQEEGAANYACVTRYATAAFSMGDMVEYTPGSINDLFYWPLDLDAEEGRKYAPRYPDAHGDAPIRIVHAPNHRGFKGTHFLIEAVERLQAEKLPIELTLVERVPNRAALEIYRTADIVFDQCLIGFHGYFALEAMAMGKPVMVFIRDPDRYLLCPGECPFINTPADRVEATLRALLRDRPRLHALGKQGRAYVERYFSLPAYAARLERTYRRLGVAA